MADSPFPRDDGLYGYEDFIEILNLVAQNSYNNRSEFGSTEDRVSNLFSSMNKSGGRQRLVDVDRNALVIPPLYLSLKEPTSLSRGASGVFQMNGTSSFGSSTSPRRSLTPTLTPRRSKTPPPTSTPSSLTRNKTPPPTKRISLQMNRSKTPPATSRNSISDARPVSYDGRRLSAPSTGGAVGVGVGGNGNRSGVSRRTEFISTENHSSPSSTPFQDQALLPNGRNSRIPLLSFKDLDTPPKQLQQQQETVTTDLTPTLHEVASHRLSIGRRSGIPQRASVMASPVKMSSPSSSNHPSCQK
jgi:hypothetical protein